MTVWQLLSSNCHICRSVDMHLSIFLCFALRLPRGSLANFPYPGQDLMLRSDHRCEGFATLAALTVCTSLRSLTLDDCRDMKAECLAHLHSLHSLTVCFQSIPAMHLQQRWQHCDLV